jgi:hypothetical protein
MATLEGRELCQPHRRVLRRGAGTVHSFLSAAGGISPTAKARSERSLSLTEREEIWRGGFAASVGRPPSTVSRELRRNGGRNAYRATQADAGEVSEMGSTTSGRPSTPAKAKSGSRREFLGSNDEMFSGQMRQLSKRARISTGVLGLTVDGCEPNLLAYAEAVSRIPPR